MTIFDKHPVLLRRMKTGHASECLQLILLNLKFFWKWLRDKLRLTETRVYATVVNSLVSNVMGLGYADKKKGIKGKCLQAISDKTYLAKVLVA